MKNRIIIISIILCILLSTSIIIYIIIPRLNKKEETKIVEEQIKKANIIVKIKEDTNIPFNSTIKISDMIEEINGKIIDDKYINTISLGEKEIEFKYVNEDNITIPYKFKVNIIDDVKPLIWLNNTYTIDTNYDGKLEQDIMCADNETSKPKCSIIGDYDTKKVGNYDLIFKAEDRSGNITEQKFTLKVKEPSESKPSNKSYINYSDIVKKYKKDNTKIGIDVSGWQGYIDYEKVAAAGVEFAFIKVGGEKGLDQEYYVDSKFIRNIEGFNNVGIPVGVYIYSYANSEAKAKDEALWVLDQIKNYKVELPIVYDWENWHIFNYFDMSLYELTKSAKVFVDTINSHGYEGSLYGSKNYLEKAWLDTPGITWLAHYNDTTSYQGDYKFWQICDNGRIDGIEGNIDINIMYLGK